MSKIFTILILLLPVTLFSQTINLNDFEVKAISPHSLTSSSSRILTDSVKYSSQETPYLLWTTPSTTSQSDNGSPFGYSYLKIRGMDGTRINYTLNGVPLNDGEDMGIYTTNYTDLFSSLSYYDVGRGPTLSNGNVPFAGSVSMQSIDVYQKPTFMFNEMYGSFNSMRMSVGGIIRPDKNTGIYLRTSHTQSDGYRKNSGGSSDMTFISMSHRYKNQEIKYTGFLGYTTNKMAWLPTPEGMDMKYNLLSPREQDKFYEQFHQIQYTFKSGNSTLTISPYVVWIKGGYGYSIDTSTLGFLNLNSLTRGMYMSLSNGDKNNGYNLSITGNYYSRTHIGSHEGSVVDDYTNTGKKTELSVFLEKHQTFNKFLVNIGAQYRQVCFNYTSPSYTTELYNTGFLNVKSDINYSLFNKTSLFVSGALSHREPTRTDLFLYNDNIDTGNYNQIANVKSERVVDIELGVKYSNTKFRLQANVFSMYFHNEIISMNTMNYLGIMLRSNADKSLKNGVELEMEYKPYNWLSIYNATTIMNSKVYYDSIGEKKPVLSAPIILYSSIRIGRKFGIELQHKYVKKSYLESSNNSELILPSYNLLNGVIWYKASDFELSLFINNLMNKPYYSSGTGVIYMNAMYSRSFFQQSGLSAYFNINIKI